MAVSSSDFLSSELVKSYTFSSSAKRPRYFDRQQLRAVDLTLEQQYLSGRTRQLNSHLHGWGVVCGAFLKNPGPDSILEEGFALTPLGDALHIPEVTGLDLLTLVQSSPCCAEGTVCEEAITNPTGVSTGGSTTPPEASSVYLIARRATVMGEPRTGIPENCGHPGNHLEYSRLCDAVSLHILCELPPLHKPPSPDCSLMRQLFCPETRVRSYTELLESVLHCPPEISDEENYVVLATLVMATNPTNGQKIIQSIGYEERRLLLPTQTLQHYLTCLCTPVAPTPTPTPTYTPTPTPTRTATPTIRPTATYTVIPTFTVRPTFTMRPTFTVLPTFTIRPTFLPTGPVIFNPGEYLTRPVPFVPGVDVMLYDTALGQETSIDELAILDNAGRTRLHDMGINTVLQLYMADTSVIAEEIGISEVQVAEFKDGALGRMERAEPITLDSQAFDVGKGFAMPVEEVYNIGPERGKALRSSGYGSVADVANTNSKTLSRTLSVSEVQAEKIIMDARTKLLLP